MTQNPQKKGLGRGLSALFGEDEPIGISIDTKSTRKFKNVPLSKLKPCAFQPRRSFDNQSIADLAASMEAHGVLQPLLVRALADAVDTYEIVAGERRWRAAQKAQIHELPVVIRELTDEDVLQIGLVENLQREDLNPLEEAQTYKKLIDEYNYTQESLAQVIGKSRPHIANMMRLLTLPEDLQSLVRGGKLSIGHARTLIGHDDAYVLAQRAIKETLSVRDLERLTQSKTVVKKLKAESPKSANIKELEKKISRHIGCPFVISPNKKGGGKIVIDYGDMAQFDAIFDRLIK